MTNKQALIQRAYDARQQGKGLTRVCLYVPKAKVEELRALVKGWKALDVGE